MGDNTLHLFFSMWIEYRMLAKWWFEHFPAQETDLKSIFFHCITSVQPDKVSFFVVIIWSKSRLQYPYLGEYFQDALSDLLVRSSAVTVLYRSQRSGATVQTRTNISAGWIAELQWIKPDLLKLKCNIDASFTINQNWFGAGMCIRAENSCVVLSWPEWHSYLFGWWRWRISFTFRYSVVAWFAAIE